VPDEAPAAASEAAAREAEARRERELLERIARLERDHRPRVHSGFHHSRR
jgi:hypothetical protein